MHGGVVVDYLLCLSLLRQGLEPRLCARTLADCCRGEPLTYWPLVARRDLSSKHHLVNEVEHLLMTQNANSARALIVLPLPSLKPSARCTARGTVPDSCALRRHQALRLTPRPLQRPSKRWASVNLVVGPYYGKRHGPRVLCFTTNSGRCPGRRQGLWAGREGRGTRAGCAQGDNAPDAGAHAGRRLGGVLKGAACGALPGRAFFPPVL